MINIALYQPDIPQNTAAIIRTCSCFDLRLEIIKPVGFVLDEKKLKRIYMDYVKNCKIIYHKSFDEFMKIKRKGCIILFTTKSKEPRRVNRFLVASTIKSYYKGHRRIYFKNLFNEAIKSYAG